MAYYNSSNRIVPAPGTSARGIAFADEMNDVHIPVMMQQMVKPQPGSIVDEVEVARLRTKYERFAVRAYKLNVKERAEMTRTLIELYNISPADARGVGEECLAAKREREKGNR